MLPAHHHLNVLYQFECHYVGRTSQRLQECIKQPASRNIKDYHSSQDHSNLSRACKENTTSQITAHTSANGQHFFKDCSCASQYSDTKFSILARGHNSFRLSALKATFIKLI